MRLYPALVRCPVVVWPVEAASAEEFVPVFSPDAGFRTPPAEAAPTEAVAPARVSVPVVATDRAADGEISGAPAEFRWLSGC